MRKTLHRTGLCMAALLLGAGTTWADTTVIQDGTDGWTRLTSLPANVGDYYYVFVDNTSDLMLALGEGPNQSTNAAYRTMVYRTSEDPAMNPAMLWTLEANGSNYFIKSAVYTFYYIQTEYNNPWYCRTHDNGGGSNEWYRWTFAYTDGSWTIQNGKYPDSGYIGPWNASAFSNGQEVAANKTGANIGHFQIYAILQTDLDWMASATQDNPVDVTGTVIASADCTSNDDWLGSGRTTATGTYYDGTSRTYFTQNHESGPARSQTVTIPRAGVYLLRTAVRPTNANAYATIAVGDESTTTRGVPSAADNIGQGWTYNDVYFATTTAGVSKTITIALSNVNASREADCGEMHLYYLGPCADFTQNGIHCYLGTFAQAPAIELTDDVPVANTTQANFSAGTPTVARTNPNGLLYAASGQVPSGTTNVIVDGTCASLQLESGHPFVCPTAFTVTQATYTLESSRLAGGQFATLVLPFPATTLPDRAYTLDQTLDLMDGSVYATPVSTIAANSPVLVTGAGAYVGSGVTVAVVQSGTTAESGQLVGVYQQTTAPTDSYVLQNHSGGEGVAFYPVGTTRPAVSPFRAYIKAQQSAARAIRVSFADDTEAIAPNSGATHPAEGQHYDLQGRRHDSHAKGVSLLRTADGSVRKLVVK